MRRLIRYLGPLAVLLVLLAATGRVWWTGRSELAAGQAALAAGKTIAAQNHFLTAARSYVPLIGAQDDAVEALLALGDQYATEGRHPEAVAAFDDARGALYATDVLFGPDDAMLARANAGYARSLAAWKVQRHPETDAVAAQAHYQELADSVAPTSGFWSLLMGLSFLAYVGCLGILAWRWDSLAASRWRWLGGAGAGFALWILALLMI